MKVYVANESLSMWPTTNILVAKEMHPNCSEFELEFDHENEKVKLTPLEMVTGEIVVFDAGYNNLKKFLL